MKWGVILIVANGDAYFRKWWEHYRELFGENIGIAHGFTRAYADCGFKLDYTYNAIQQLRGNFSKFIATCRIYKDKTEQQNTALSILDDDTDYIFIADVDEFIKKEDFETLKSIIEAEKPHTATVNMNHYWKSDQYICKGGLGWAYDTPIPRVFKYTKGCFFTEHRPIQLNTDGYNMHIPIKIDHYSYVDERMVREKMEYYGKVYPENANKYNDWFLNCWMKWTPENREEIEKIYSVHPSSLGAKTEKIC